MGKPPGRPASDAWVRNARRVLLFAGLSLTAPALPAVVAAAPFSDTVTADRIAGRASVIDGDTIDIHGRRIRFHGIDAPESRQLCLAAGALYRCGQKAALALADRIGSATVACTPTDRDRYGRTVAVCRADGIDLNAWMVRAGWAVAYRRYSGDYVGDEEAAAAGRAGIWQGTFVVPADWRRGRRLAAEGGAKVAPKDPDRSAGRSPPGSCAIKGNVSAGGARIYHLPGGRFYEATRIDTAKGERWFCSEVEAEAAGWRRSRQ